VHVVYIFGLRRKTSSRKSGFLCYAPIPYKTAVINRGFLCYYFVLIINSIKGIHSWEANILSTSQQNLYILWNLKARRRVHKSLTLLAIQNEISSTVLSHLIALQSILLIRLHRGSIFVPSAFPTKTLYAFLSSSKGATSPALLILFDFVIQMLLIKEH
jgi:hypothetical protein